jgi:hypothetical protein
MMIEVDPVALDGFVREWLKDTLRLLEQSMSYDYIHPEDLDGYEKDIKAVKRLLDYIGETV